MFLSKSHRHKSGKRRSNRLHAQLSHTVDDFVLQFNLRLLPLIGERSIPFVQVAHTVPREICRGSEKVANFFFSKTKFNPHALCDSLGGDRGKRHIHAMESHPVDFAFPACPVPIWGSVAIGAHIEKISQLVRRRAFCAVVVPSFRQLHRRAAPCGH